MSFFSELKRRNVLRAMAAYIAGAWLLTEITGMATEVYGAPDWVMKVVLSLMLAGAIPAGILSWYYELTSSGLKKDSDEARESGLAMKRGFNLAIVIMLVAAVAIVFVFRQEITGNSASETESVVTAEAAPTTRNGPPTVAVLPFTSISLEDESAFFAAGIHDDLLTQLARLKSLRVISRTSVMAYKDTQRNLREIGIQLGADSILEGSVQSAGDRIRINAQLIDARTDEHLWAETYDRELTATGIFDVQSEISRAIATAMHASLSQSDSNSLSMIPTDNMAAYRAYHEAVEMQVSIEGRGSQEYRDKLERAVELDPGFMRAQSELVGALTYWYFNAKNPADLARAEQALDVLARDAPGSLEHQRAQAFYTYYVLKDFETALAITQEAIETWPSDLDLLELASWIQRRMADWEGQIESARMAWALDPGNPSRPSSLAQILAINHRYDEALDVLQQYTATRPASQPPSPFDGWIEVSRVLLEFRNHRDINRLVEDSERILREYPNFMTSEFIWDRYLTAGRYEDALAAIDNFGPGSRGSNAEIQMPLDQFCLLITEHLRGNEAVWRPLLEASRQRIEENLADSDENIRRRVTMQLGSLAAMEGDIEKTRHWLDAWRVAARQDNAQYMGELNQACYAWGTAGMDAEATACVREAISRPSQLFAFYDPWLPAFDPVRDQPEFSALMEELEEKYGPVINIRTVRDGSD